MESEDASRRTRLATERTLLAWWRTGLGALAVGIGIGRVVPELSDASTQWPYVTLGVAFTLYGIVLILFGAQRFSLIERALTRGEFSPLEVGPVALLAGAGALLGAATVLLVLFD